MDSRCHGHNTWLKHGRCINDWYNASMLSHNKFMLSSNALMLSHNEFMLSSNALLLSYSGLTLSSNASMLSHKQFVLGDNALMLSLKGIMLRNNPSPLPCVQPAQLTRKTPGKRKAGANARFFVVVSRQGGYNFCVGSYIYGKAAGAPGAGDALSLPKGKPHAGKYREVTLLRLRGGRGSPSPLPTSHAQIVKRPGD